ncbi:MAG TPA: SCO family protein [Pyrinomonadaceae bacterium]|nr:SCO family protein [Pyrinomonadaceae bacterium]
MRKAVVSVQCSGASERKAEGGSASAEGRIFFVCLLLAACCSASFAQGRLYNGTKPLYSPRPELGATEDGLPVALREVKIEQRLNEQVPLDLKFKDDAGREVTLRDYFDKGKPVVLSLVFYKCPMLCDQILTGLLGSLRSLSFDVGREFDVVTVSFDPRETPELAAEKKLNFVRRYNREGAEKGWHFLTGDQENIARLTDAVGFRYDYDEKTDQFAHAAGIMVLTPDGRVSRYFYGVEYFPKDLRFGLIEASDNKIGSLADQLLLYCYHYDPATGRYGPVVMRIMRLGGVATVLGVGALLLVLRRRGKKGGARARLAASQGAGGTA